jgi:hypothetical protein
LKPNFEQVLPPPLSSSPSTLGCEGKTGQEYGKNEKKANPQRNAENPFFLARMRDFCPLAGIKTKKVSPTLQTSREAFL